MSTTETELLALFDAKNYFEIGESVFILSKHYDIASAKGNYFYSIMENSSNPDEPPDFHELETEEDYKKFLDKINYEKLLLLLEDKQGIV